MKVSRFLVILFVLFLFANFIYASNTPLDHLELSPFGQKCYWLSLESEEYVTVQDWKEVPSHAKAIGVVWFEERDVEHLGFSTPDNKITNPKIQYWFKKWPSEPPTMPTIEDPLDDPWQGQWLEMKADWLGDNQYYGSFIHPLTREENPKAENLPGVTYRRTMKVRFVFEDRIPPILAVNVLSPSTLKPLSLRIRLSEEQQQDVFLTDMNVFNGKFESIENKDIKITPNEGIAANLLVTDPSPAGSNDITVVTVQTRVETAIGPENRTFSFSTRDLEKEPIYIPEYHAYISLASDTTPFNIDKYKKTQKIRERISQESEQTYERAKKEIPPLDPWKMQYGSRIYLPVAADSSWQKFAVEYGGNFFIGKRGTKAMPDELKRLQWEGDRIDYKIGTGATPYYRDDQKAQVCVAEEHLPIVITRWNHDGVRYEEEAFATLLRGPLDPNSPERSEQTPAILMSRIIAHNPAADYKNSSLWLTIDPEEPLKAEGLRVYSTKEGASPRLRGVILTSNRETLDIEKNSAKMDFFLAPGETRTFYIYIPFVSDLSVEEAQELESIPYAKERDRVASYWRDIVNRTTRFTTPEDEFNQLARFVVPHIHISSTKDPRSGLYMVPAASYNYKVYANETCFQTLLLDALGDTERAGQYLETLMQLQGSRSFPGNYVEPHDGVFHGAKVDEDYDYTASNYGLDHGTILWTLARHYMYTRDTDWLRHALPHMEKGVEWIERQRALTKRTEKNGERTLEYGLLPSGHLEDNDDWGWWFSVNAYCVAGMVEMAKAMADIRHPEADAMKKKAEDYLHDLRTAVLRMTELAPVTRMKDGTYSPYVPTKMYQRFRYFGPLRVEFYSRYNRPDALPCYRLSATREVLYGPMILLNLGIFDIDEPIAEWILDDWEDNLTLSSSGGFNVHGFTDDQYWFSQGGMVFQSNLQNPVLVYLMRNETEAAIRNVYNSFAALLYPDVNTLVEEYRMWSHPSGPFYKSPDESRFSNRLRDMLALEMGDDLWLACGIPRRWWSDERGIHVDRINTEFGPIAYSVKSDKANDTIQARIEPPKRNPPKNLWLYARLPEGRQVQSVEINGQEWKEWDERKERLRLPQTGEVLKVRIKTIKKER